MILEIMISSCLSYVSRLPFGKFKTQLGHNYYYNPLTPKIWLLILPSPEGGEGGGGGLLKWTDILRFEIFFSS